MLVSKFVMFVEFEVLRQLLDIVSDLGKFGTDLFDIDADLEILLIEAVWLVGGPMLECIIGFLVH